MNHLRLLIPQQTFEGRIEDKLDSNHKELSQKIDKQSEEIGDIKVELAEIKAEVKNLNKDVTDLKGSTKAQRKDVDRDLGYRNSRLRSSSD